MKKILLLLILILCIFITSCGKREPNHSDSTVDGIPFEYYNSFDFNKESYDLYIVDNPILLNNDILDEMLLVSYRFDKFQKENTKTWIINYNKEYNYISNIQNKNQEFLNEFYSQILGILDKYEYSLGTNLTLHENGLVLNYEYIVDLNKEFSELFIIDLYIPFRIFNTNKNQTYFINVPVKTFLGYRNNNQIELVYEDNNAIVLNYELFISLSNINENI